jgi:integrase/recombinase XerD
VSPVPTVEESIQAYTASLSRRPISENTRKAFVGDARIFQRWLGDARRMNAITAEHVRTFLENQERSGTARSPKSVERRLTSLKVFFDWAHTQGHIAISPAEGVAYRVFMDPLPEYLTEAQADAALQAARHVAADAKLEMRPLVAIALVLDTGIKKIETRGLRVTDVTRDGGQGSIRIRYLKKHLRYKDRDLSISPDTLSLIDSYVERVGIRDQLFDCTGRNIEYMFNRRVAPLVALSSLTFEQLRWTCAIRDWRAKELSDAQLQHKFGLSAAAWTEMASKLTRIAHSDPTS